jgi:predicted AAA+ superfamily ATPase
MGVMSFREYLLFQDKQLPVLSWEQITNKSVDQSALISVTRTLWEQYLMGGCYPLIHTLSLDLLQARLFRVVEDVIIQDI